MADVAIAGGGIIGLSIAFELASRGASVRVYDSAEPARAASWAAAGMLAPLTERLADDAMQALCEASLRRYPAFASAIANAGGVDPYLSLDGILHTAYDDASLERLAARGAVLEAAGHRATLLDRAETLLAEPALGKHVRGALLVEGEGQIDNRRLGRALAAACRARGVRIHTGIEHLRIECDARRVLGVRSSAGYVPAGAIVNAAGAWAAQLEGVPQNCVPTVRPVKGQMLAIEIPKGFMRHTIWVPGGYLVPRRDGRLLVGATVEEAGYDARVTSGGIASLLRAALDAAPALSAFSVSETWAGLRPGTPDERPYVCATPLHGYYLAAGHYRNGILLAPETATLVAGMVEGAAAGPPSFTLERFSTKARSA